MQRVNHDTINSHCIPTDIYLSYWLLAVTKGFPHWICKFPTVTNHHVPAGAKQLMSTETTV